MDLIRKFYAPATPGGGGSSPADDMGDTADKARAVNEAFAQMKGTLLSIAGIFKEDLNKEIQKAKEETDKWGAGLAFVIQNAKQDLVSSLQQAAKTTTSLQVATMGLGKSLGSVADIEGQINNIKRQRETIDATLKLLQMEGVEITQEHLDLQRQINEELEKQEKILEKVKKATEKTEKTMKGYVGVLKAFNKIPLIGGLMGQLLNADKVMESMKKKQEKLGAAANTTFGRLKILGAGLVQTFKNITNPITIGSALIGGLFTLLYKVFMMAINLNKKFFETAKILGVSVGEATKLYGKFQAMAPLGMRAKEVAEAYAAASDSLGFMASSGADFAITMTGLQKNLGASAEHMTALATQSALSGKSINGTFVSMVGTAKAAGAQNKLVLSTRQILDKIAKVSSTVLINFKGNVNALATAVVRATKLGTTLDQINKQAESLLDFETSIASEFEAEALTGKNINLEKARSLALSGKTAELMEELNAQGMTMGEFENMNVIQREAFAKAIGLSNEEFSKQLIMQKQAEALGAKEGESLQKRYNILRQQGMTHEQIAAKIGEQEAASLRQQSLGDKWAALLERIQDILGSIVMGPVTEIVNKVIAFLNNTQAIQAVGEKLKGIFQGISKLLSNLPAMLQSAVQVSKVLASLAVARAVASIMTAAGMAGPAGLLIAGAAGAMAYNYLSGLVAQAGVSMSSGAPPSTPSAGNITPTSTAATAGAAGSTGGGSTTVIVNNTHQVDGHKMSTTTNKHTANSPRSTFDNSTGKATMNVAVGP